MAEDREVVVGWWESSIPAGGQPTACVKWLLHAFFHSVLPCHLTKAERRHLCVLGGGSRVAP